MSTELMKITGDQLTREVVKSGEAIEADVIKKGKNLYVNQDEFTTIVNAYAKDLATAYIEQDRLQEAFEDMQRKVEELESVINDKTIVITRYNNLGEKMDNAEAVIDNLEASVREFAEAKEQDNARIADLETAVSDLTETLDAVVLERDELAGQIDALSDSESSANVQVNMLKEQLEQALTLGDQYMDEVDVLRAELEESEAKVEELREKSDKDLEAVKADVQEVLDKLFKRMAEAGVE